MDELARVGRWSRRATAEESYDVLDVAGDELHGGPLRDRPRAVPATGSSSARRPSSTAIDRLWRLVLDNPHVIGDFTWTGWDYLGEAGIGRVDRPRDDPTRRPASAAPYPWLLAHVRRHRHHRAPPAAVLLPRDRLRAAQRPVHRRAAGPSGTAASCRPRPWAWTRHGRRAGRGPARRARRVTVEVYSDADEVELLLDGESLGRAGRRENGFRAEFEVTYAPGELVAVARTRRRRVADAPRCARRSDHSGSPPRSTVNRSTPTDTDLAYVSVWLTDASGVIDTGADRAITVTIDGPATLQGFASADPRSLESYRSATSTTYEGRALAVIRPSGPGTITATFTADGLDAAACQITAT